MSNLVKSRVDWFMKGSAHYLTMYIGFQYAKTFPMYFVVGFPRSGTSWLSDLVADYYNLPRPKHYYLPIACAAVLHTHFKPNRRFKNTFYIYRDGRDSYTSYFFVMQKLTKADPGSFYARYYKKLLGDGIFDEDKFQENFYLFLKDSLEKKITWSKHIDIWLNAATSNREIVVLSFENLLKDTFGSLSQGMMQLDGKVNEEILKETIERNSFAHQKKRPESQHKTPLRKGQKNSWRELFTPESAQLFDKYCGDMLIRLGYEKDRSWLENFSKR